MSNLIPKLRHRIKIQTPVQTPMPNGTLRLTYVDMIECWSGIKAISEYVKALRDVNTSNDGVSHVFTIRKSSVQGLSDDVKKVKTDMFIFLYSTDEDGRRFRIHSIRPDEDHKEYVLIKALEEFEEGIVWEPESL